MLRRVVEQAAEWQIPVFVMDCDVAAAVDHVSHHGIIEAMWVPAGADCRLDSESTGTPRAKLDDIGTLGIRRTRSVPQGDPCAADLLWAALGKPTARFCDMFQPPKWGLPMGSSYLGLLLIADICWTIAMS